MVATGAVGCREKKVAGALVPRCHPVLAQDARELRREHDIAARLRRLQRHALTVPIKLVANPDEAAVEVDVAPDEPERLADPQPSEDADRDERAERRRLTEQSHDLALVEHALLARLRLRPLVALELGD